jgi:hypothetical protein
MKNQHLSSLALSDSGFLFNVKTGHTFTLNNTGTSILRQLISGTSPDSIVKNMTETFDVPEHLAKRDVEQFIVHLKSLGLLEKEGLN